MVEVTLISPYGTDMLVNVSRSDLPERIRPYVNQATTGLVRKVHRIDGPNVTEVWERYVGALKIDQFTVQYPLAELGIPRD